MSKLTKWHIHPAKTQLSLGICPDWSVFTVRMEMPRLIWVWLGAKVILLVLSCCGSNKQWASYHVQITSQMCHITRKPVFGVSRPGQTTTGLLSYWLEPWNFGFIKYVVYYEQTTKRLSDCVCAGCSVSCCSHMAYRFCHDAAQTTVLVWFLFYGPSTHFRSFQAWSVNLATLFLGKPPRHASGPKFDPHIQHILAWRLGHENISTAILPLLLIQEE